MGARVSATERERESAVSVWHLAFDPFDKCNIFITKCVRLNVCISMSIYVTFFHPSIQFTYLSMCRYFNTAYICLYILAHLKYTTYSYVCVQWDSKTAIIHLSHTKHTDTQMADDVFFLHLEKRRLSMQ